MNKQAVTQAQLARSVKAAESLGKTVYGIESFPDGRVRILLTRPVNGSPDSPPPIQPEGEGDSWDTFGQAHGNR